MTRISDMTELGAIPVSGAYLPLIYLGSNFKFDLAAALNAVTTLDPQLVSLGGLSYTGNALKVIRVNAGETGFEVADAQASDALLSSIAGLTFGADSFVYGTGSDTAAAGTITSVGRTLVSQATQALMRTTGLGFSANGSSLVAAADYAAMKTLLGLTVGTDVQAYNAVLANVASSTYDAALKPLEYLEIALSDETTAITTGDGKASWFYGYDFTITEIYIGLGAAQSSSGVVTVDVNKSGSTILSTKATIGASLNNSLSGSGSVSPVISTATSSKGDKFTADVDAAGTGAKGLKLIVIGHRT